MKSETIKKINTFGKVGYIICKIGKIVVMIAAIACLVGGILMCFVPTDAVKIELSTTNSAVVTINGDFDLAKFLDLNSADGIIEIGNKTYQIVPNDSDEPITFTSTVNISNFKWICFACMAVCVAFMFVSYFAEKLCRYFKDCETPFTTEISGQLTKLAWSLIPTCVLGSLMQSFTESMLMGTLDLTIGVDLITVLLILCVFMLSYIFKHGAALQTESDELL